MPSTSKKQHNFMAAIANNSSFAKKVGIPQSVGKDFSAADKGRKFKKGGATMMGKKIPSAMADMMARRRPRMGAGMPPPAPPVMPPQPPAPMGMKKGGKVRRFQEGGFSEAQEAWLSKDGGKPDRTDPHILERMRKAVPDEKTQAPAPVVEKSRPYIPEENVNAASTAAKDSGADPTFRADSFASTSNADPKFDAGSLASTAGKKPPAEKPKAASQAVSQAVSQAAPPEADSPPSRSTYRPIRNDADAANARKDKNSSGFKQYETSGTYAERLALARNPGLAREVEKENKQNPPMGSPTRLAKDPELREAGFSSGVKDYIGPKQAKSDELAKLAPRLREAGFSSGFKKYTGPEQKTAEDNPFSEENRKQRAKKLAADLKVFEQEAMTDPDRQKRNARLYETRIAASGGKSLNKGGAVKKYAKGGMAHGGMHKMPDGKMMKNSAMKEGGMPMKDGKPAFMMKKMSMGGMAKGTNMNSKGSTSGSSRAGENTKIQKRGLTEGRMIKMAAGGSVGSASRRADGIAQRGKTRG